MELFKTWKKNMVLYGLKSQIGTVYRNNDRTTSFYDVGNFLYLAGSWIPDFGKILLENMV